MDVFSVRHLTRDEAGPHFTISHLIFCDNQPVAVLAWDAAGHVPVVSVPLDPTRLRATPHTQVDYEYDGLIVAPGG